MAKGLTEIMAPIQAEFEASQEWKDITEKAYPPPPAPVKKKKIKDKGSRHPGHQASAQKDGKAEPGGGDGPKGKTEELPAR